MTDVVIDREQVFLLFATFAGDVEKTAHAAGIRAVDVLRVADEEGWQSLVATHDEYHSSDGSIPLDTT